MSNNIRTFDQARDILAQHGLRVEKTPESKLWRIDGVLNLDKGGVIAKARELTTSRGVSPSTNQEARVVMTMHDPRETFDPATAGLDAAFLRQLSAAGWHWMHAKHASNGWHHVVRGPGSPPEHRLLLKHRLEALVEQHRLTVSGSVEPSVFDYAALDAESRIIVQQKTGEIRERVRAAGDAMIGIGERLIAVKQRLPHGRFGKWLEAEFGWSQDTAEGFINAAKLAQQNPKFSEYAALFDRSAARLIAAPSTPEPARDELIERAAAGERITHKEAKGAVQHHKAVQAAPATPAPAAPVVPAAPPKQPKPVNPELPDGAIDWTEVVMAGQRHQAAAYGRYGHLVLHNAIDDLGGFVVSYEPTGQGVARSQTIEAGQKALTRLGVLRWPASIDGRLPDELTSQAVKIVTTLWEERLASPARMSVNHPKWEQPDPAAEAPPAPPELLELPTDLRSRWSMLSASGGRLVAVHTASGTRTAPYQAHQVESFLAEVRDRDSRLSQPATQAVSPSIAEMTTMARHDPIVPTILCFASRQHPYELPKPQRVAVEYGTPQTIRLVAPGADMGRNQFKRTAQQTHVWCIPDDAAWERLLQVHGRLQGTLDVLANHLRELGSYPKRLAEAGGVKDAPNPLTPTVIWAADPDRDYSLFNVLLHLPSIKRYTVKQHTAQMIRLVENEATISNQQDFFVCPTDAEFDRILAEHQAARDAKAELERLLDELGTYSVALRDGRYLKHSADPFAEPAAAVQPIPEVEPVQDTPSIDWRRVQDIAAQLSIHNVQRDPVGLVACALELLAALQGPNQLLIPPFPAQDRAALINEIKVWMDSEAARDMTHLSRFLRAIGRFLLDVEPRPEGIHETTHAS